MVAVAHPEVRGAQRARIEILPDGEEHPRWQEVLDFSTELGIVLDPWQERVLWASLLRRKMRRKEWLWAAFTVAVCAPRQNGKNGILELRELAGAYLLGEEHQLHSAHLADTHLEAFRRIDDLLDANEWLSRDVMHIRRTNGQEAVTFRGGNRIRFRTRTRGGGRGYSGSPVYFDEAMFLPEVSLGAMLPVISAQPDPQVWYTGSAVDQLVHDAGISFARVRERAVGGQHERLAYFEWSAPGDAPDAVSEEQALDSDVWAQANPALGIRISPDYIRAEQRELDPRTFAVERLGVGDWPRTDGTRASVIDLELWAKLADSRSRVLDPVCFVFDVRPDRAKAAVVAVGRRPDDRVHGEVLEHLSGTDWICDYLVQRAARNATSAIACDGAGPAASLVPALAQAGLEVQVLTGPQIAQACGLFFDLVQQGKFRHRDDDSLTAAVKGAAKRPLGDAWAWSRKNSQVDISPLVACTIGAWCLLTRTESKPWASSW